jgi:hypothetical protein
MMHGGGVVTADLSPVAVAPINTVVTSSFGSGGTISSTTAATTSKLLISPIIDPRTIDQLMGLPMLDSNPGAPATLYLDFNGNSETNWFFLDDAGHQHVQPAFTTPIFDTDGNTGSFGASEQAMIKQIWSRVAEDYAPFNINVSTDYYGSFNDKQALHVVIGGNNTDWLHEDTSGISSIGSFSDSAPNTVFVFDLTKWTNVTVEGKPMDAVAAIADTASHEAGHAFGLRHHSRYSSTGVLLNTYDPGTSDWTPIMGENKASDRTTWSAGATDQGALTYQDDIAVIGSATNGFGFRTDDHADTSSFADALVTKSVILGTLGGSGIINTPTDVDVFKFTTQGGPVQITMNASTYGPNLIPVVELRSSSGFITKATTSSSTQSIISTNLAAGTYYVYAKAPTFTFAGHVFADYGDVGQYTVTVSTGKLLTQDLYLASSTTSTTTMAKTSTTTKVSSTTVSNSSFGSPAVGQINALVNSDPVGPFGLLSPPFDVPMPRNNVPVHEYDAVFHGLGELDGHVAADLKFAVKKAVTAIQPKRRVG